MYTYVYLYMYMLIFNKVKTILRYEYFLLRMYKPLKPVGKIVYKYSISIHSIEIVLFAKEKKCL